MSPEVLSGGTWAACLAVTACVIAGQPAKTRSDRADPSSRALVCQGTAEVEFLPGVLSDLGCSLLANTGGDSAERNEFASRFEISQDGDLEVAVERDVPMQLVHGVLPLRGAYLASVGGQRVVLRALAIQVAGDGGHEFVATPDGGASFALFRLDALLLEGTMADGVVRLGAELVLSVEGARFFGAPQAYGTSVGRLSLDADLVAFDSRRGDEVSCTPVQGLSGVAGLAAAPGADVLVADLQSVVRFATEGNVSAYGVGTTACNIGTARANWISHTNEHPVIVQNLYRLKDQRFEQIGMSWAKHGFYAVSQSFCDPCNDPTPGTQLGVGCSDPYSASLNAAPTNMSPTATVNPNTGYFPYPWPGWQDPPPTSGLDRRLQVQHADLEPLFNAGARYFVQGHYVNPDDAAALVRNHHNNASYREVLLLKIGPSMYDLKVDGTLPTQRGQPALRAWKDVDPSVQETDILVPGEGLYVLAAKAFSVGTGVWRYVYALQNLNSDRAAGSFSVPISPTSIIANIGFHDVDYHSGEPFETADWTPTVGTQVLTWSSRTYAQSPNANALRFGLVYTFWFETDVPPTPTTVVVGLFKPGTPSALDAPTVGPQLPLIDCNANGRRDDCDLDCSAPGCMPPCGGSVDCNDNDRPDECEIECNANGIPDDCDLRDCPAGSLWCADCDANGLPDGCEPDCDGDGVPDACDTHDDSDGDGVMDCFDRCAQTPTSRKCMCPSFGICCWFDGEICVDGYPPDDCIDFGGVPDCMAAECRQGCLLGDFDENGWIDLSDAAAFQNCFSGESGSPGFVTPSHECAIPLDFNEDDDIDLEDFRQMTEQFSGP